MESLMLEEFKNIRELPGQFIYNQVGQPCGIQVKILYKESELENYQYLERVYDFYDIESLGIFLADWQSRYVKFRNIPENKLLGFKYFMVYCWLQYNTDESIVNLINLSLIHRSELNGYAQMIFIYEPLPQNIINGLNKLSLYVDDFRPWRPEYSDVREHFSKYFLRMAADHFGQDVFVFTYGYIHSNEFEFQEIQENKKLELHYDLSVNKFFASSEIVYYPRTFWKGIIFINYINAVYLCGERIPTAIFNEVYKNSSAIRRSISGRWYSIFNDEWLEDTDGSYYIESELGELIKECDNCREIFRDSDVTYCDHIDEHICSNCLETSTYVLVEDLNEYIYRSDATYIERYNVFVYSTEEYSECDSCGEYIYNEDLYHGCWCESCYERNNTSLKCYSANPTDYVSELSNPTDSLETFGFELETYFDHDEDIEETLISSGLGIGKSDSSIKGFEICSTYGIFSKLFPLAEKILKEIDEGFDIDEDEQKCHGLHIHVNRKALSTDDWLKLYFFINYSRNKEFQLALAGDLEEPTRWAIFKPIHISKLKNMEDLSSLPYEKYTAFNTCHSATIELRYFRSRKLEHVLANLEEVKLFVDFIKQAEFTSDGLYFMNFIEYFGKVYQQYKYAPSHIDMVCKRLGIYTDHTAGQTLI